MAKKTRPHKRSRVRKAAKHKPSAVAAWTSRRRTKIVLAVIALALLATASFAYWKAPNNEVVAPASVTSEAANKSRVKDVPTLSEKELADIPPEAFHSQPSMPAGYNAHNGGLPPGALPHPIRAFRHSLESRDHRSRGYLHGLRYGDIKKVFDANVAFSPTSAAGKKLKKTFA
jgi:hypothetical protein